MKTKIILGALTTILIALGLGDAYEIVKKAGTPDSYSLDPDEGLHKVVKIIDGDTIDIETGDRIRLMGSDAPDRGECFYSESKEFLETFLAEKEVRLEKDITGSDKFGRLLRYAFMPSDDPKDDDVFVNYALVNRGYATTQARPPDNKYRELFYSAQKEARQNGLGLWTACSSTIAEEAELKEENESRLQENTPPPNEECVIKGNISEKGYGKIYFIPGCNSYTNVNIDPARGEQYFCTEEEAVEAGFRKADNCP